MLWECREGGQCGGVSACFFLLPHLSPAQPPCLLSCFVGDSAEDRTSRCDAVLRQEAFSAPAAPTADSETWSH